MNASPYGKSYDVDKFIVHPQFTGTGANDVALVRTWFPIEYNAAVGPVCLPYGNDQYVGRYVDLLGWGKTSPQGYESNVLQKTTMSVISFADCKSHWGAWVKPEHLCTHTRGRDFCMVSNNSIDISSGNGLACY